MVIITEAKREIQRWYHTASTRPDRTEGMRPSKILIPLSRAFEVFEDGPRTPESKNFIGLPVQWVADGPLRVE